MRPLTPADLEAVRGLLPYTAQTLIGCIGAEATCALLNTLPGCELYVPKHADQHRDGAQRWAELAEIVGEDKMQALAARWGGDALYVPTCDDARREIKHRAIRALFDRLTMTESRSARQAIYEIGLKFAPISNRQIEKICGRADASFPAEQGALF
jgi:hypothetical protein